MVHKGLASVTSHGYSSPQRVPIKATLGTPSAMCHHAGYEPLTSRSSAAMEGAARVVRTVQRMVRCQPGAHTNSANTKHCWWAVSTECTGWVVLFVYANKTPLGVIIFGELGSVLSPFVSTALM